MPGIGGRLGWNEPPPAATTTTLTSNTLPRSVVTRNSGSPIFSTVSTISLQMEGRTERLDLLHQRIDMALRRDIGHARNVVDRLLRIKLGALAADLVEDVDEMRLHVEQAELEHGEQPAGPGADDQHVGLDGIAHISPAPLTGGVCVTVPPGGEKARNRETPLSSWHDNVLRSTARFR